MAVPSHLLLCGVGCLLLAQAWLCFLVDGWGVGSAGDLLGTRVGRGEEVPTPSGVRECDNGLCSVPFSDGLEKYLEEESKSSASVLPGEIDDLQDVRAPTIAQLLQEKTLYSFSEWPKVSRR